MKKVSNIIIWSFLITIKLAYGQSNWVKQNSGTTSFFTSVDFINNDTGLIVGTPGIILKTIDGGKNWIQQNSGTSANLGTVSFVNKNIAYICGDNGLILKTINGGNSWFTLNTGITYMLYSADFIDSDIGYAAGMGGIVIKTINGGATWEIQNSNITNHIYNISFLNKDTGFIAAKNGSYVRTIDGGKTWTPINSGVSTQLNYIKFYNKNTGYMVGDGGNILKSTNCGLSWTIQNSGTSAALNNIQFTNLNTAYTVGVNGTILKTTNGGQNWVNDNSGVSEFLTSVFFPSENIGYAVGQKGDILKTSSQLSSISGYNIVCQGQQNVNYSVQPNSKFTSYGWNYSGTGMSINGSSNSISANFADDATSGVLSVTVTDNTIGTLSTEIQITVNQKPSNAGIVKGATEVCAGQNGVGYSIPIINNASSYIWSYSGTGITINGSTNNISINFSQNAMSGNLTTIGSNICGNGPISNELHITIKPLPSDAGKIIGNQEVCSNQGNIAYSIPLINNATDYIWNFTGNDATIIGNKDSIALYFFNNATSGNLSVYGENNCGKGTISENFPIIVKSCTENPTGYFNIPNAFTPNGDGVNDYFIIRGITENTKIMIFDRFGKMLYESNNYHNDWDGKDMDGHSLESGTYWYIISVPSMPSEYKGFVYIKK